MNKKVTTDYRHIRLEPVDNGYVLDYTEIVETPGSLDNRDYLDRKKVYGEDQLEEAMAEMKKLFLFKKAKKAVESTTAPALKMMSSH